MAYFRRFVPGLSYGRSTFPGTAVLMGFVVGIAARGQAFLRVLWFFRLYYSTITVKPFSFIYNRRSIAYIYF